jgi:lipoate---protein ligase
MKILDHSFDTAEENLACDEALLDETEASGGPDLLRFWSSRRYFAVLGYSNAWKEELNSREGVPVFRRCTGGGTVLQGPGCLNYSLVLRIRAGGPLDGIRSTNAYVMERHRGTLSSLLGSGVRVQGHTDLTLDGLKFSGNSQRRKKNFLLFHGTFLLDFDLPLIERWLKMPPKQPAYREGRAHAAFVTNLGLDAQKIKEALTKAWRAGKAPAKVPHDRLRALVKERYSSEDWNFKF